MSLQIHHKPLGQLPLYELSKYTTDISWREIFESCKDEIERIEMILHKVQKTYVSYELPSTAWLFTPKREDLFNIFRETSFKNIRVLILSSEPLSGTYENGDPIANGIAFSAYDTIPKCLEQIFVEITRSYPDFKFPTNGDLRKWCRQGVMLLNTSLTKMLTGERQNQRDIWLPLIAKVIETVTAKNKNMVICFWGREVEFFEKYLNGSHHILKSSYPTSSHGFAGCGHFKQINDLDENNNKFRKKG